MRAPRNRSPRGIAVAVAAFLLLSLSSRAHALIVANPHVTDGQFTSPAEWAGVTPTFFPVVGNAGGSFLYVQQLQGTLYLMYDYPNGTNLGFNGTN
ncbi:MAG TPA: hypothetical protein VGZ22_28410, partial [Isosphaeraceae bacterium]|nr:hypothetical protein [Isosphaeraceae bacterium]